MAALAARLAGRVDAAQAAARRCAFIKRKELGALFDDPAMASDAIPVMPQRVVGAVAEAVPEDAIICSDAGSNRHWMNHFFRTRRPGCYFGCGGIGGVSWSLPAALTAQIVHPERPAIGVCSDGGFAMQMHTLLSAVQYGVAPITVVMNNSQLGMTAEGMGNRAMGSELPDTDYAAIARSMGAKAERVTRPGDIAPAVRAAVEETRGGGLPTVIDVVIDAGVGMRQAIYSPLAVEAARGIKPLAG